ncbi:MAG: BrnA antitoxin family protein [Deltaproteobacteria bacterium]|nr:BrnA antitoxin family protein [Deltaproteobacteria bacterium]
MKKRKSKIEDQPIGELREISDLLPPPEKLAAVEETVKVTLTVDRGSLEFFKAMADKLGGKYQRMMREVLRGYAQRYAIRKS